MIFYCPGSRGSRNPQPEILRCQRCGEEVEIWTDEVIAVCPRCHETVKRKAGQSCLDWCRYAKDCAGGGL